MNFMRIAAIAIASAVMLLAPWTELGAFCIIYVAPAALGATISHLSRKSRRIHSLALTTSLVISLSSLRLFSEGLTEGSFYFDGEWDLVVAGVIMQAIIAIAFWSLVRGSQKLQSYSAA
jgi:hypothetical protein